MSIKFPNSFYLEALKDEEMFSSDVKIREQVMDKLLFKYGDIENQQFNQKYSIEGWLGRKITALPRAIWSGVVQPIFHLALAILIGIPKICLGKSEYLKVQLYNGARDLQEAYGHLVTLIHDRHGQFHVQESQFQKFCYQYFVTDDLIKKEKGIPFSPQLGNGVVLSEELKMWLSSSHLSPEMDKLLLSKNIKSLEDLRALSEETISSITHMLKPIPKKKFLKAFAALKESSSLIIIQKFAAPSSIELDNSFKDSGENIFRTEEDLSLEELKLAYQNEIECIMSLNRVLGEDQNKKAKERLTISKKDRQEHAQRLQLLINSKGGKLDDDLIEQDKVEKTKKIKKNVSFSP